MIIHHDYTPHTTHGEDVSAAGVVHAAKVVGRQLEVALSQTFVPRFTRGCFKQPWYIVYAIRCNHRNTKKLWKIEEWQVEKCKQGLIFTGGFEWLLYPLRFTLKAVFFLSALGIVLLLFGIINDVFWLSCSSRIQSFSRKQVWFSPC